jgi:hypothetical protein
MENLFAICCLRHLLSFLSEGCGDGKDTIKQKGQGNGRPVALLLQVIY